MWLDDLYMSVPCLAQAGKLTGERRYYDDAAKQILQFADRMFVKDKGLFMHAWAQDMEHHPAFHWARANGWAIMAMAELLDVLPQDHPSRARILGIFKAHAAGLTAHQGHAGLWHQLLDRRESYEETSASAMFVFAITRGINRGWLDQAQNIAVIGLSTGIGLWALRRYLYYLGHAEEWDEVQFKGTPEHPPFIALLGKDGLVAAVVACDEGRAMAALAQRMKQPLPVDEAWRLVRDFSM